MNKSELKMVVSELKEVLRIQKMDTSSFDIMFASEDDPLPKTEKEVTDFIRRRTRLWRHSWIEHPLNSALSTLQKHLNKLEEKAKAKKGHR